MKSTINYNFNYDFKSIKFPDFLPQHIIIFTGGIAPLPSVVANFFENLKFNSTINFIIAADSGLDTLCKYDEFYKNKFSFEPNVILGDMDSLQNDFLLKKYLQNNNCQIEEFDSYKDYSDTELALILASKIKTKNTIITLIGGTGKRVDHFLSIFDLYNSNIKPNFWLTQEQVLTFLFKNKNIKIFPNNLNSPISIFRLNLITNNNFIQEFPQTKDVIKTNGFEWESDLFRNTFSASLSNVIKKDFFEKKIPIEVFSTENILIATEFSTKIALD